MTMNVKNFNGEWTNVLAYNYTTNGQSFECGSLDEGLKVEARQPSSSRNTERVLFGRELAEKNLKTYSNQESIPTSGYGESNVIV